MSGRLIWRRRHLLDASFVLTAALVAMFGIRSQLVLAPLGSVGSPSLLIGVAGAVWWAFYQLQRTKWSGSSRNPVRVAVLFLLVAFSASFVVAMQRPIASLEVSVATAGMVTLLGWLGIALLACDGITDRRNFDRILNRFVVAAMLLAALGVAQFVTGHPLWAGVRIPGLTENAPLGGVAMRNGFSRPAGTATHPIEFGAALTLMLPVALTRAKFASRAGRHLWWLGVAMMGMGIVVAISRSALICAFVGVALLGWTWKRQARTLLLGGVMALLFFVALTSPGLLGSLKGLFTSVGQDSSVNSRTESYGIALDFFARSPLLGRGYATFLPRYRIFDNEYLLLLIDVGVLGLVAFLVLLATAMRYARRGRRLVADEENREIGQALFAGIAAATVGLAFYDGLSFPLSTGALFFMLGLTGSYYRLATADTGPEVGSAARRGRPTTADSPSV